MRITIQNRRVAGVYAPAFVERNQIEPGKIQGAECRRGLCPGLR